MELSKVIGTGNTATVYDWEEGKVLKLFKQGYPEEAVEQEYRNAMAINHSNFLKPKAYNIISYDNRKGIIYDKIVGESLLDWVLRTSDLPGCAIIMAELHKAIGQNKISDVPNYKEFLKHHLSNTLLSIDQQNEINQRIEQLPEGDTLCHGDFHPGNILILDGKAYVIDFMNICHGDFLYDVARTVYLVEYTPVAAEVSDSEKEMILFFKKSLTDLYLNEMNVTREMIQDYLSIISIMRKGECPNE